MDIETQTHLKTLREMLTYRLAELRAEVHAAQMARAPQEAERSTLDVNDQADQAAQWLRVEVSDAEEKRDVDELTLVEQALQRMDEGRYGDCVQCGQAIPLQRLLVQPAASRCAACQGVAERFKAATAH